MTGIKAEWRLSELDLATDNPFDTVILTSNLRVDLSGDESEIHRGITRTVELESRLFDRGVTCDLKDDGQDCRTCPAFTADYEERRRPLCQLGRDQHLLLSRAEEFKATREKPYLTLGNAYAAHAALAAQYAEHTVAMV